MKNIIFLTEANFEDFRLHNGFDVLIREPQIEDAESIIKLMKQDYA